MRMSVDKQIEQTAAVEENELGRKSTEEENMEISREETAENEMIALTDCSENDQCAVIKGKLNRHFPEKARDWFESLSNEEFIAALGFTDEAFLKVLLLLSPSSWSSFKRIPEADKLTITHWATKVDVKDVSMIHETGVGSIIEGNNTCENEQIVALQDDRVVLTSSQNTETDETRDVQHDEGNLVADHHMLQSSVDTASNNDITIFDHCCLIFPCSFQLVSQENFDNFFPYVILEMSCFETYTGTDILKIFDRITIATFGRPFLLDSNTGKIRNSWYQSLGGIKDGGRVPVGALLLARFEHAVFDSYTKASSEFKLKQNSTAESGATNILLLDESKDIESFITSDDNRMAWTSFSVVLKDIFDHSNAIKDLSSTMDSSVLSNFMEPFIAAFKLDIDKPECFEPTVLASTPLHLVLASACDTKNIDYEILSKGVSLALQRMQDHGSESLPASIAEKSTMDFENDASLSVTTSNNVATLCDAGEQITDLSATVELSESSSKIVVADLKESHQQHIHKSSKKKKKKNKKKKSRKLHTNTTDVTSVQIEDSLLELKLQEHDVNESAPQLEHVAEAQSNDIIVSIGSFDSANSVSSDQMSEKSETSTHIPAVTEATSDAFNISQLDGRIVVVPPVSETINGEMTSNTENVTEVDDSDDWETVGQKKNSRKKSSDRFVPSARSSHYSSQATSNFDSNGNKKNKNLRPVASKRRNSKSKSSKESYSTTVDYAEVEPHKQQAVPLAPNRISGNPWKNGPPVSIATLSTPAKRDQLVKSTGLNTKEISMRDIVVNSQQNGNAKVHNEQRFSRVEEVSNRDLQKKMSESTKALQPKRNAVLNVTIADQNTAPTYQETVSAVSTNSIVALSTREKQLQINDKNRKNDFSSGDTVEGLLKGQGELVSTTAGDSSPAPPLPTLLNPENANSSTSSVASSLEAPHVAHTHHHSKSVPNPNDVGYHLLDVCDKLSKDMSLFMRRRSIALDPRRRERAALLGALQTSVSSLWPDRCNVELYGSCAINLDLPSSDLDVVVVGLDRLVDPGLGHSFTKSPSVDSLRNKTSVDQSAQYSEADVVSMHQHIPPMHSFILSPGHYNGERVLRLAAELEIQPWAVQVKPIPTASVPVVKILADPSRLSRDQSVSLTGSTVVNGDISESTSGMSSQQTNSNNAYTSQTTNLPWRGSDVVNGLLALDITFEGPEHGGIGSTEFSSRVISEACLELGLIPEETPFVQVLMVLKELLAQRKLNEPFSGGLSSYALLLLVLAVVRERSVIREEIERVERQRRAMASIDATSYVFSASGRLHPIAKTDSSQYVYSPSGDKHLNDVAAPHVAAKPKVESTYNNSTKIQSGKNVKSQSSSLVGVANGNSQVKQPVNTWANVAKKASENKVISKQSATSMHNTKNAQRKEVHKTQQKPTFADALTKSTSYKAATIEASSVPAAINIEKVAHKDNHKPDIIRPVQPVALPRVDASTHDAIPQTITPVVTNTNLPLGGISTYVGSEPYVTSVPGYYSQGVNDVIEVLCSGEITSGKLLMHFFLYYGQYFDAQSTAIDISGKHVRDFYSPSQYMSPFIPRRAPGSIDPVTGMLIVDPIVVFDPLEGAENNNVARRCYAWNNVRWIFAQSYATLSSAVERSATSPTTPNIQSSTVNTSTIRQTTTATSADKRNKCAHVTPIQPGTIEESWDPSSHLLSCLLSI